MTNVTGKTAVLHELLSHLIHLRRADTLYADIYTQRARSLLASELNSANYLTLKRLQVKEASLPNQVRNAMNHADWSEVAKLSGRYKTLQAELESKKTLLELAGKIYDCGDVPIDPFSPGMDKIAGFSIKQLPALREEALHRLDELARADRHWQDFYRNRRAVFSNLAITSESLDQPSQQLPASVLEEEAAQAMATGNMAQLEILAGKLAHSGTPDAAAGIGDVLGETHKQPDAYPYRFPQEVLKQATALGLQLFSVPSRREEFAPLCHFAWHPTYSDLQGNQLAVHKVPDLDLPQDLPAALKARIQLFAVHPFINSAGVRFLPSMVAEDVLVEDFPEPEAGSANPVTGLLEALGLPRRNQLSRQQLEAVLLERGSTVLRDDIGLDPREFKLICIPPDLHLRIGQERGWGLQKIWTHFDGYMIMADAQRQALAGGDVRYGGIYDLLGLSCSYDSDRIIARFAVVQRRRLALWQ